ncbi:di-heme enzyme [Thalassotalea loyana]|uniref:Di-heme enzyme n=1 Tax=Thalassotalea loyana TaxID=280483 RepID=A0ABQ6HCA7_9GAMM|nr:methanobactin export MATE transporter MbnM [Thalassotalea loyana]GLX85743.1 di-heme enzyme [Thalassotalea loyana]
MRIVFVVIMSILLIACEKAEKETKAYKWPIPNSFPKPQVPIDNPMSDEKVALGRVLFFDCNLSFNRTQSCSSCHEQSAAFGEKIPTSVGSTGQKHRRNAQVLVNVAYNKTLTWAHDGLISLEQQILIPMFGEAPVELGITGHEEEVLSRFRQPKYSKLFEQAFPEQPISYQLIVNALASYVRSLVSLNSPFDQYAYQGDDNALSASAIRGMNLFFSERLECHHCHGGFNFTQSTSHEKQLIDRRPFHNTGLYNVHGEQGYPKSDIGLGEISQLARDNGRFRAPTLRNITESAPYMHDGSIATLSEVIDFYAAGGRNIVEGINQGDGRQNPYKSEFVKGFELTEQDKADLLNFLASLTDNTFITNSAHGNPNF